MLIDALKKIHFGLEGVWADIMDCNISMEKNGYNALYIISCYEERVYGNTHSIQISSKISKSLKRMLKLSFYSTSKNIVCTKFMNDF